MQMLTCAPEELWICHSRRPTVRVPLLQLCRTAGPQYGIIKKKNMGITCSSAPPQTASSAASGPATGVR